MDEVHSAMLLPLAAPVEIIKRISSGDETVVDMEILRAAASRACKIYTDESGKPLLSSMAEKDLPMAVLVNDLLEAIPDERLEEGRFVLLATTRRMTNEGVHTHCIGQTAGYGDEPFTWSIHDVATHLIGMLKACDGEERFGEIEEALETLTTDITEGDDE